MAPWLPFFEAWLVQQLLRTPGFHRGVEKVARHVHRMRHGLPPDELGGTKLDQPGSSGFSQHFLDEIKTQLGRAQRQEAKKTAQAGGEKAFVEDAAKDESAEAIWRDAAARRVAQEPERRGFMNEYIAALKSQVRGKEPPQ